MLCVSLGTVSSTYSINMRHNPQCRINNSKYFPTLLMVHFVYESCFIPIVHYLGISSIYITVKHLWVKCIHKTTQHISEFLGVTEADLFPRMGRTYLMTIHSSVLVEFFVIYSSFNYSIKKVTTYLFIRRYLLSIYINRVLFFGCIKLINLK